EGTGPVQGLARARPCRHTGYRRGTEGTGRVHVLARTRPVRHAGDGRWAERAGRPQDVAITPAIPHEGNGRRHHLASAGVAQLQAIPFLTRISTMTGAFANRQPAATCLRLAAIVALAAVTSLVGQGGAMQIPFGKVPEATVAAWKKAGAQVTQP